MRFNQTLLTCKCIDTCALPITISYLHRGAHSSKFHNSWCIAYIINSIVIKNTTHGHTDSGLYRQLNVAAGVFHVNCTVRFLPAICAKPGNLTQTHTFQGKTSQSFHTNN